MRVETQLDQEAEERTMRRLLALMPYGTTQVRAPELSFVDRFMVQDGRLRAAIEVKTRKQTDTEVRAYGGLMLKHRKLLELQHIADLMQIPTYVVYAFSSGHGAIYTADVTTLTNLQPQEPPRRRNYRGLACDLEEVVYLDWANHLRMVSA